MDVFHTKIAEAVAKHTTIAAAEVRPLLGAPRQVEHGDVALPCFKLATLLGRQGKDAAPGLAKELAEALSRAGDPIRSAEAAGPYVNVRLDPAAIAREVLVPAHAKLPYGGSAEGAGKTIVIDFSSPNIAKPFHLGHLRSTVIGWSLRQIFRTLGYTVVGVNHLGDWGTQFGLMMAAWERWKHEAEDKLARGERDVDVFVELYVRINKLKKQDPKVAEEGRQWFLRLEQGEPYADSLWRMFVDRSLAEFKRIYQVLGITHESEAGEAFYNDKMPATQKLLEESGLLVEGLSRQEELAEAKAELDKKRAEVAALESNPAPDSKKRLSQVKGRAADLAARVKKLEGQLAAAGDDEEDEAGPADRRPRGIPLPGLLAKNAPPDAKPPFAMLLKGDGGTTYTTRDLTAARYRAETYKPAQVLYVVGNTQRDHFIPWFEVVRLLGEKGVPWARGLNLVHVGFGNYLGMSTRKGTAVFLDEVIARAGVVARAAADQAEKKVELTEEGKEDVARAIGVGALKFFDLKGARTNDIDIARYDEVKAPVEGVVALRVAKDDDVAPGQVVATITPAGGAPVELRWTGEGVADRLAEPGSHVEEGALVARIDLGGCHEDVIAPQAGIVSLRVAKGDRVAPEQVVAELTPAAGATVPLRFPRLKAFVSWHAPQGAKAKAGDAAVKLNLGVDWDRLLNLKGDAGPYLQFAHARLCGILRRNDDTAGAEGIDWRALADPEAQALIKAIAAFPGKIRDAAEQHEPSVIARYLLELSTKIHQFLHERRVLDPKDEGGLPAASLRRARVLLVFVAKKVLAEALDLLGIEAPEVM